MKILAGCDKASDIRKMNDALEAAGQKDVAWDGTPAGAKRDFDVVVLPASMQNTHMEARLSTKLKPGGFVVYMHI